MKLQEEVLLAKLSAGDLIAQDAMYHLQCLNCVLVQPCKGNQNDTRH